MSPGKSHYFELLLAPCMFSNISINWELADNLRSTKCL